MKASSQTDGDGPEFSSDPMPAAFIAFLFLGVALLAGLFIAVGWRMFAPH